MHNLLQGRHLVYSTALQTPSLDGDDSISADVKTSVQSPRILVSLTSTNKTAKSKEAKREIAREKQHNLVQICSCQRGKPQGNDMIHEPTQLLMLHSSCQSDLKRVTLMSTPKLINGLWQKVFPVVLRWHVEVWDVNQMSLKPEGKSVPSSSQSEAMHQCPRPSLICSASRWHTSTEDKQKSFANAKHDTFGESPVGYGSQRCVCVFDVDALDMHCYVCFHMQIMKC